MRPSRTRPATRPSSMDRNFRRQRRGRPTSTRSLPASVDSRAGGTSPFPIAGSHGIRAQRNPVLALSPHSAALRRARGGYQQTTPPWLISYADLITLLLCFFILLTGATRVEQH